MSTSLWPALLAAVLGGSSGSSESSSSWSRALRPIQAALYLSVLGEHALYWWIGIVCFVALGESASVSLCLSQALSSEFAVCMMGAGDGWRRIRRMLEEYIECCTASLHAVLQPASLSGPSLSPPLTEQAAVIHQSKHMH